MGAIVLKYVQLICVAFFMKNTNCDDLLGNEELSNVKVGLCMAECLKENQSNHTEVSQFIDVIQGIFKYLNFFLQQMQDCYNDCVTSSSDRFINFVTSDESAQFNLYCRDSQQLTIKIDHNVTENSDEQFMYMLKVKESTGKFADRLYAFVSFFFIIILKIEFKFQIILNLIYKQSDEKLINVNTVDDLQETLSYDITAYIISSLNSTVQKLEMKQFTTLMADYKPEDVTVINPKEWREYFDHECGKMRLNFTFTWEPERSHTCDVEVLFYDDESDIMVYPVPIDSLYEYTLTNLSFDFDYHVAIRALNMQTQAKGIEQWNTFEGLVSENPLNIVATLYHIDHKTFDVNVTWVEPKKHPDHYKIDLKNLYSFNSSGIYSEVVNGVSFA